jgi:putative ATP-binding cassette transporter
MNLLSFLLRSSWRMVTIAIITGFLSGGSSAALIALVSHAVGQQSAAMPLVLGFAGLAVIAAISHFISQVVLIRLSQRAVYTLRLRLSQQILATELSQLEQLGMPRLLATLTEDIQAITIAVQNVPFLCIDLAIILGCFSYLVWLYWSALALLVMLVIIGLGSCQWLIQRGRKLMVSVREEQDQLFQHFRTLTEGIKELKLHQQRQQDFLANDLQHTAANFERDSISSLTLFAITSSWGQFVLFLAIGLVLFALPHLLQITPQTLTGYVLTFIYLMLPMDNLINNLPNLSRASVALRKIETLNLALSQPLSSAETRFEATPNWQLQLKGVTHTYRTDDRQFSLGPIDLSFEPGEIVFIIGGNGSGKSTFAKLITGLYIPEGGAILWNGEPITEQNRVAYRQQFSAVFFDFYLFERLLNPSDDSRAEFYLKQLQLDHKVQIKDNRLSTTALSQGQRKRLALLSAYLDDRPIYLFDEWASDQDPAFKEVFYRQIMVDLRNQGKAVLVISHDDRYFDLADRLIKLEYGKVEYDKRLRRI